MSNAENFEKWKADLESRYLTRQKETVTTSRDIFTLLLKNSIIAWWDKQKATCIPETVTWGTTCLEFAFEENPEIKRIMTDFLKYYPDYEGDLELFVIREWDFESDVMQTARQHSFVLLAWQRQNAEKMKLDEYGLGESHPDEQWQKDNAYAWRRIQEDVFKEIPYTFDRLDIAYETFSAAGLYGGMKFFAEQEPK